MLVAGKRNLALIILLLVLVAPIASFATTYETDSLLNILDNRIKNREFSFGECKGKLYVKQNVDVHSRNIFLNWIPDLTRFDRDEFHYLTELYYDVRFFDYTLPVIRRMAHLTTHNRGRGEMERVMGFMSPAIYSKKLLKNSYLSPLHSDYKKYYIYNVDTIYSADSSDSTRCVKVNFKERFDNIKLLRKGWFILDDSCAVCELYIEGWDEQCEFKVKYTLNDDHQYRNLIKNVSLDLHYDFAGNDLYVQAQGVYEYSQIEPLPSAEERRDAYDLSIAINNDTLPVFVDDRPLYASQNRKIALSPKDSSMYIVSGVLGSDVGAKKDTLNRNATKDFLWAIGEQMLSAYSIDWQGGSAKVSPLINPSYLSYSSSKGLSYKMSLNLKSEFKNGTSVSLRPMGGYNFKQGLFYWDINGKYMFDPMSLGVFSLDVGSDNRSYSSVALERIEEMASDILNFKDLNLNYFKHIYLNTSLQRELANGLELLAGVNFHRRSLVGSSFKIVESTGIDLKRKYIQFAPHVRVTWHPGMYYYIKDGRKINLGSRKPRISFDVEQGMDRIFGSDGIYTRAELDVQYNCRLNETDKLYLRVGGGGFFYTKNVYFADYAFLKNNYLPVDRSDELGGVFQLLDSEWYNAANKYMRAHVTYESPFFILQRTFPRVNYFKNERIYCNTLFISHLVPYTELGYGVETPYVDMGVFVSGKKHKFHSIGYKITLSLFRD